MLFTWDSLHASPLITGGIRQELLITRALVFLLWPRPGVDLRACAYLPAWPSALHSAHNGITPLWSCCSLTHDHTDPWMGISAGFSKPNICASQHCHCSNHSLNQNTKSNFTWMPQHEYLIMAENKSLFSAASSAASSPYRSSGSPLFGHGNMREMDLMNILGRFIAAIRPR